MKPAEPLACAEGCPSGGWSLVEASQIGRLTGDQAVRSEGRAAAAGGTGRAAGKGGAMPSSPDRPPDRLGQAYPVLAAQVSANQKVRFSSTVS